MVTGGAGFVGSHLVDYLMLAQENRVIVLDNLWTGNIDNIKKYLNHPSFDFINEDVTKEENVKYKIDKILTQKKYKKTDLLDLLVI